MRAFVEKRPARLRTAARARRRRAAPPRRSGGRRPASAAPAARTICPPSTPSAAPAAPTSRPSPTRRTDPRMSATGDAAARSSRSGRTSRSTRRSTSAASCSRTPTSRPSSAGARPAARWSATSRSTSRRRSPTPPASCRSRCAARRSSRRRPTRASARTCARSSRPRSSSRSAAASSSTCSSPTRSATRRATSPRVWGRNFPYPCQILYLPQNANSAHAAHVPARRVRPAAARASRRSPGAAVTDDDLRRSIAVFNENRAPAARALRASSARRPGCVSADEAYVLVAVGGLMPREEHNALLRARRCRRSRQRPAQPQDKIRVVFEGGFCEQPPLDLLRAIGRSCYVVDDDLLIGLRWILRGRAAATAIRSPTSPRPTSSSRRTARCSTTCASRRSRCCSSASRVARADAAIVTAAKMCEPGLEEQVAYTQALDEARHPVLRQRVRGEHDQLRPPRRSSSRRSSRTCCSTEDGGTDERSHDEHDGTRGPRQPRTARGCSATGSTQLTRGGRGGPRRRLRLRHGQPGRAAAHLRLPDRVSRRSTRCRPRCGTWRTST